MKKILYACAALVMYAVSISAQEECPGTLVHYWNMNSSNGGFADQVGGLNAQIEAEAVQIKGIVDSAFYFNGLSEASVPDNITFDWGKDASFTIEFWISKSVVCPSTSPLNNNVVIGRDDPNSTLHWWVGVDCQNPGRINFTLYDNGGNGAIMKTKTGIIDGNWHHVAVVRDGQSKTSTIFLDSEPDTSISFTYLQGFGSVVPVNIGWLNRDAKYHLDAMLDELAIHNVALTSDAIAEHYNSGNGMVYCTGTGTPVQEIEAGYGFHVFRKSASEISLKFKLASPEHVSVAVYDISGRNLGYLINEELYSGEFEKTFRTSQFGKNAILLIRASFANITVTRKISMD